MKNELPYKGYARIYVEREEDIPKVHAIIKELDEYEFDYMPKDLVAPFSEYPALTYTHKFNDLCMNRLTACCYSRGIRIFVFNNGSDESMQNHLVIYCSGCGAKRNWDQEPKEKYCVACREKGHK